MFIKQINIKAFGKLRNASFFFEKGFNLIYGDNESGKSTLFSFIIFAFYGIKHRKSPRDISFKDKYLPWSGEAAEGEILFEYSGDEYSLKRVYSSNQSSVKLFNISGGRQIDDAAILNSIGEFFFGVDCDTFTKTAFLSSISAGIPQDSSSTLVSRITNLMENGDETISGQSLIDEIDLQISMLSSSRRKNSLIPALNEKLDSAVLELHKLESLSRDTNSLKAALAKLNSEKADINRKLSELKPEAQKEDINKSAVLKRFRWVNIFSAALLLVLGTFVKQKQISIVLFSIGIICAALFFASAMYKILVKRRIDRKGFTIREFNDKILMLNNRLAEIDVAINISEQNIKFIDSGIIRQQELKAEIEHISNQIKESKLRLDAYELAKLALQHAYEDTKLEFIPKLALHSGKYLNMLTRGKYSDMLINDRMNINIHTESGYNNVLTLSRATVEQVYLSVRMSLSELMFNSFNCPVFLDDAFAFYDHDRLQNSVECLHSFSENRQLFFATCRKNELNLLKNKEINVINLNYGKD